MKEIIDELNKKFNEYRTLVDYIQDVMDKMAKLEFANKREAIDGIRKIRNDADEKMKNYHQAVLALRKVCPHMLPNNFPAFETISEDLEVCSICGYELRRKKNEKSIDNNQD